MSWKEKIPGAFGCADKKFARHALDSARAAELLAEANKEGVGFGEYLSEIESWLKSQGCSPDHIRREIIFVKDLSSYLKYD